MVPLRVNEIIVYSMGKGKLTVFPLPEWGLWVFGRCIEVPPVEKGLDVVQNAANLATQKREKGPVLCFGGRNRAAIPAK